MFSNKLNFLMNLCGEKNTELSNYLQIDPSYISRLRAGTRQLTKNQDYLKRMGDFFSEKEYSDYQILLLENSINEGKSWPTDREEKAELIYKFLADNSADDIEKLFIELSEKDECFEKVEEDYIPPALPNKFTLNRYYFGTDGKKEAVMDFIKKVVANGKPREIYLYSDDEAFWIDGDDDFFENFIYLAVKAAEFGCTYTLIHQVSQTSEELFRHAYDWLPLYITGKVKPLFFPNNDHSIVKKTELIAKDLCAIISNAMAENNDSSMLTFAIEDTVAINSLLKDFKVFTNGCVPLMSITQIHDLPNFKTALKRFNKPIADAVSRSHYCSVFSLNKLDVIDITKRIHEPKLIKIWESYVRNIKKSLDEHTFTEILTLLDPNSLKNNNESLSLEFEGENIEFPLTVDIYLRHLRRIIKNLKKFDNYNVRLSFSEHKSVVIHTKRNEATCIFKGNKPTCMLTFTDQHVNQEVWKFLDGDRINTPKEDTIKAIEEYMDLF